MVADHDQAGRVVWAAEGKNAATVEAFHDQLGEAGCAQLQAIRMHLGAASKKATDAKTPQARQCVDPFHLVGRANGAINKARRWALLKDPDALKPSMCCGGLTLRLPTQRCGEPEKNFRFFLRPLAT